MTKELDKNLLDKLRKVKALAEDAKDEAEGVAAMLAYQRLLSKNGLNESEVAMELDADEEAEVNRHGDYSRSSVPTWQVILHSTIAEHFRCMSVSEKEKRWTKGSNGYLDGRWKKTETLKYVGMGNDPLLASKAFESALVVAGNMWRRNKHKFINPWGSETIAKNSYMSGFIAGLQSAFKEQEAKHELGLIIVRDKRVDESLSTLRTSKRGMTANPNSAAAHVGFTDGHNYGSGDRLQAV